jgi:hypothetical protein
MSLSRPWTERWPRPAELWFVGFASLLWTIALYYLRAAHGWVVVDDAELRTSRLIRGRSIRWTDVQRITTRTYAGRGGSITVVKVHPRRGPGFLLPAPRTTIMGDRVFETKVRQLQAHAHKAST